MKKHKYISFVQSGRLSERASDAIRKAIQSHEGKEVVVTIERRVKSRTNPQNRYLWGVLYPLYLRAMLDVGDDRAVEFARLNRFEKTVEALHEFLLLDYAGKEQLDVETGELVYLPCRTSQMSTLELNVYMATLRQEAYENYSFDIPLPDDERIINELFSE